MNRFFLVAALVLLVGVPASAGVVYESEVTDHEHSPGKTESIQTLVEGRRLKVGTAPGGRSSKSEMIYHGDRREMVVVDHARKSYFVMDREQIAAMASQVGEAMAQVDEVLKNVPEGQRAMVEKMMKQPMPQQVPKKPETDLRKTGERATHNGYPCLKYELWKDGRKDRELWVTDWKNVEGSDEVVALFVELGEFVRQMTDAFGTTGGKSGAPGGTGDNVFQHIKELKGFPVLTREFGDDGSLTGESILRSAKRQSLDPAAFEPPSGYKRQEMPGRR